MQQLQPWFAKHASEHEKLDFCGDLAIVLDNADRGREARTYHKLAIDLARCIGAWSDAITVQANLSISWATAGRLRGSGRYADALRWAEPALAAADGQLAAWKPLVRCDVACGWIHLGQHGRRSARSTLRSAPTRPTGSAPRPCRCARACASAWATARATCWPRCTPQCRRAAGVRCAPRSCSTTRWRWPRADALGVARDLIAENERLGMPGGALAGLVRAIRFAVDAGLADAAILHGRAAAALGDDVVPSDLYPAEQWLSAWRLASGRTRNRGAGGPGARRRLGPAHAADAGAQGLSRPLRPRQPDEPAAAARGDAAGPRRRRAALTAALARCPRAAAVIAVRPARAA